MTINFEKTKTIELECNSVLRIVDDIKKSISVYDDNVWLSELERHGETFRNKVDDFFRENRKLNIAVVGRMKAGKSTFLNMLLFRGKEVLPRAFTPKTATLTKIEYDEVNSIEIEYYSINEWGDIVNCARNESGCYISDKIKASQELVKAIEKSGIDPEPYLKKGREEIKFPTEDLMMSTLNKYVGNDGDMTPLVKCVILRLNREELKGLSIVDTPGLNDEVLSRTVRTREFLELCDVVFFLSAASQFLDGSDIDLLKSQLPIKGVQRLVLVASRFDEALYDENYNYESFDANIVGTKQHLKRTALQHFGSSRDSQVDKNANALFESAKNPFFVSSIFHNMTNKNRSEYDEYEEKAFNDLNEAREDLTNDIVDRIGDISELKLEFDDIISQKDATLAQKAKDIVPLFLEELKKFIENKQLNIANRLNILVSKDKENLEKQKKEVQSRINNIKSNTDAIFVEIAVKIEQNKASVMRELREAHQKGTQLDDHKRKVTYRDPRIVSDSTWYKPWTWGSSHTKYDTRTETITFVDVCDAIDNIRECALSCSQYIEDGFARAVDFDGLKKKLLHVIIDNMDVSSTEYDPALLQNVAYETIRNIKLPIVRINSDAVINNIDSRFSGAIENDQERAEFKIKFSQEIVKLYNNIINQYENEVETFKASISDVRNRFTAELIKDFTKAADGIIKEMYEKTKNIKKLQSYDKTLEECLKLL